MKNLALDKGNRELDAGGDAGVGGSGDGGCGGLRIVRGASIMGLGSGMVKNYVEKREGVYYAAGSRVSLDSLVYLFQDGASPESIREEFDSLTLEEVYGAVAFYLANQAEIDAYLAEQRRRWSEMERNATPPSPELRERLDRARQRLGVRRV